MEELIRLAKEARRNAYAPYSGYTVGAAIEAPDGRVWSGVNVENVSYGGTICAERSAAVQLVSAGAREIRRLAVATEDGGTPCGICLQFLSEFSPDPEALEIAVVDDRDQVQRYRLRDLLPKGFGSTHVKRTERTA